MGIQSFARYLRGVGAVVFLVVVSALVPAANAQMPQVAITGETVQAFVASFAEVKKMSEDLSAKYGDQGGSDAASSFGAWLAVADAQGALNGAVQAHGFDSFANWVQVLTSVANAYAFAKGGAQMSAGMADAIAQIKNNPDLPAAQKDMMLKQMQTASSSVAAVKPPQANIDAVMPYMAELAVVFDDK